MMYKNRISLFNRQPPGKAEAQTIKKTGNRIYFILFCNPEADNKIFRKMHYNKGCKRYDRDIDGKSGKDGVKYDTSRLAEIDRELKEKIVHDISSRIIVQNYNIIFTEYVNVRLSYFYYNLIYNKSRKISDILSY